MSCGFELIKEPCTKKIVDILNKLEFPEFKQLPISVLHIIAEYTLYVHYDFVNDAQGEFKFFKCIQRFGKEKQGRSGGGGRSGSSNRRIKLPSSPSYVNDGRVEAEMNGEFYLFYPGPNLEATGRNLKREIERYGEKKRVECYSAYTNTWKSLPLTDLAPVYECSKISVIDSVMWIMCGYLNDKDEDYILRFDPYASSSAMWTRFPAPKLISLELSPALEGRLTVFCMTAIDIDGKICMMVSTQNSIVFLFLNQDLDQENSNSVWSKWWELPTRKNDYAEFAQQDYITGLCYCSTYTADWQKYKIDSILTHTIFCLDVKNKCVVWTKVFNSEENVELKLDCFGRTGSLGSPWPKFSLDKPAALGNSF